MASHIVDSDRHVIEPLTLWESALPDQLKKYIPVGRTVDPTPLMIERIARRPSSGAFSLLPEISVNGESIFNNWGEAVQIEIALRNQTCGSSLKKGLTPKSQIESMDESGIERAYLFPTYAVFLVNNEKLPAEVTIAFAQTYNQWLKEYCSVAPDRLKGVALLSRHNPQTMVSELVNYIAWGWKTVALRPEVVMGRSLGHPDYEPFWKACEDFEIGVALHGGTHLHAPTVGSDRFTTRFALHACSHPLEAQMAFLALLESGVLERHPQLKIAFLEAGASWLPYWLWRLDEICYGSMPGEVAENVTMPPSQYFKRQCWIGFELEEPCLRQTIETVGADRLLFGTDFPHPDHFQFSLDSLSEDNSPLSSTELQLALVDNPNTFFGE